MTRGEHSVPLTARIYRADEVPVADRYWRLSNHWPFPLTPLYADFEFGGHFAAGYHASELEFREYGTPGAWIVVDGYVYHGTATSSEPPPPARIAVFADR